MNQGPTISSSRLESLGAGQPAAQRSSTSTRHIPSIPGWSQRIFKDGSTRPVSTTRHHYYANIQTSPVPARKAVNWCLRVIRLLDLFAYDGIRFCAGLALGFSTPEAMLVLG